MSGLSAHVKLQTWFPFPIQVYVNGHAWLARRLDRHGVRYQKRDNVFVHVSDLARAQTLADGFASVDGVRVLGHYARCVNPLLCATCSLPCSPTGLRPRPNTPPTCCSVATRHARS